MSFGSLDSDYYAKLDIGKAVDETVYFQDNQHLNDRIPYWCPLGDEESWEKIVFSTSLEDLTIQRNGQTIGTYNGSLSRNINISQETLTIQKNGTNIGTYNGDSSQIVNITVPTITYGTGEPSGGNNGDVYMRYL